MKVPLSRFALPIVVMLTMGTTASPAHAATTKSPQVITFNGGGDDTVGAITVDAVGNIYLAGSTRTPTTSITFAVVKLDPQGALVWRTTYSGSRGGVLGIAEAVAVDAAGNVYAAGSVGVGDFIGSDSLVLKLGPDGVEKWARRYDGPGGGTDVATEIAVDRSGSVYVSGTSQGSGSDWVTQRFGPDGAEQWTRRHSGPGSADDRVRDMRLAPDGNIVVAGTTRNNGDGVTNDIEVLTYDPQGAIVWQRPFTATVSSDELVGGMGIDAAGTISVTGSTAANASPEFGVPFPITLRYNAAGVLLQKIPSGGDAIDVDANGNAYVTGTFPALRGNSSEPDISATAKYDTAGNQVWKTQLTFGARDFPFITGIAVDSLGMATVAATVTDRVTLNQDYLTIRYAADGHELWRHRFNGAGNSEDQVAGLAVNSENAALVAGTSVGTASFRNKDMVTLKFPAGATPAGPPAAPSQLTASSSANRQIRLSWEDNADGETGFGVERCRGAGCTNFTQIALLGPDVNTFLDSGLARNTSYTYRVRAFDGADSSSYSNTATAVTRLS